MMLFPAAKEMAYFAAILEDILYHGYSEGSIIYKANDKIYKRAVIEKPGWSFILLLQSAFLGQSLAP
jgi:hypothetical protein